MSRASALEFSFFLSIHPRKPGQFVKRSILMKDGNFILATRPILQRTSIMASLLYFLKAVMRLVPPLIRGLKTMIGEA